MASKGKLTGKAKANFVARMKRGKAKAASRRTGNPVGALSKVTDTKVLGVPLKTAGKNAAGIALGAYLSYQVVQFLNNRLISRLSGKMRGVGYIVATMGTIVAGTWAQKKKWGTPWPLTATASAIAVPMALAALADFGVMPLGSRIITPAITETGEQVLAEGTETSSGTIMVRKINGRTARGTLVPAGAPNPAQMGGTISKRSPVMGTTGGFGATL